MFSFINIFEVIFEFAAQQFNNIYMFLEDISGWIILLSGVILGVLSGVYLNKRINKRSIEKEKTLLNGTVAEFLNEKSKAEAILIDLDVGVLAYNSNGILINYNPASCSILEVKEPPSNFKQFLMKYGQENGLHANYLLGSVIDSVIFQIGDKTIKMRLKEALLDHGTKAANIVVLQDITEQEKEEKRRKEFVANVSHELKTPLTTIKTYSEALLEWGLEEKNKESIRKDIFRIHEDAVRMGTLVENLLLLSSIDSKGICPKMDQYDLVPIVRGVVDRLLIQAEEKNIELTCYSLTKLPWVFIDKTGIERIMINIISNAIKYTDNNGKVSIYLGVLSDDVYVKVSDTGFGIDKDKLPFIFNRFYRVDITGSRMYGGTGLGLAIAKELAMLHGGDISVKSILGKGTDFIVRLPNAKKVFEDTICALALNTSDSNVMYRMACDVVLSRAKKDGLSPEKLTQLSKKEIENLAQKTVYEDDWDAID